MGFKLLEFHLQNDPEDGLIPVVLTESYWGFEITFTGLYGLIWFEAVTGVNMKIIVLLDMTLCGLSQIMYYHVPEDDNGYKLYDF